MTTVIHTDGSCHGNPGPGGWAAIILTEKGENCTLRGAVPETTNNRMELTAVIYGLRQLGKMPWVQDGGVEIHTDSKYVCDAFQQDWVGNWRRNGWRTAKKQSVLNRELWEELIPLVEQHRPSWHWVKGHSGDHWNELCDQMANQEADQAMNPAPAGDPDTSEQPVPDRRDTPGPTGDSDYDRGWRDGYEAARQEMLQSLQVLQSLQSLQSLEAR